MSSPNGAHADDLQGPLQRLSQLPAWLARAMDPGSVRASLLRHVPELVAGRARLLDCTPSRLRAKGEQWLARYELVLSEAGGADPDGSGPRPLVLTGELEPPADAAEPEHRVEARFTGAFGAPDWAGWLPDLRLRLRTEVSDTSLPALPALTDPDAARALLEDAIGAQSVPGIRIAVAVPEIVRYKPGSRCTLRYRLRYDPPRPAGPDTPDHVVVKTYQGEKGANAFAAMSALWASVPARTGPVAIARPLAYLPEPRVLVQAAMPGQAGLSEGIRAALLEGDPTLLAELRGHLAHTARGIAALHGCGVRHGRVHTWEDERDEVRELTDRLAHSVPALATAVDPLLDRLGALAARAPADEPGPAHHDFRPGQVLIDRGGPDRTGLVQTGLGFIDFDGFCTAEPALDLGRFRAKLRDVGIFHKVVEAEAPRGAQLAERLAALDELCDGFLAAYREHAPVSPTRVLLWETTDLLTGVLHAWSKVRLARLTPRLALLEHQIRRLADSQLG